MQRVCGQHCGAYKCSLQPTKVNKARPMGCDACKKQRRHKRVPAVVRKATCMLPILAGNTLPQNPKPYLGKLQL
jgi:hypothetical protein